MKVLIVEDERFIAQSIAQLVGEHSGCFVAGMAANGAEALELLAKTAVDLVITDIRMPVMDGMELLHRLHAQYPQVISIVLSGYSDFEYVRAALQSQAFDYLLKPVVQSKLFPVLDRVKEQWQTQEQARQRMLIQQGLDGRLLPEDGKQPVYVFLSVPSQSPAQSVFGADCHVFRSSFEQIVVVPNRQSVPKLAETYLECLKQEGTRNLVGTAKAVPLWTVQKAVQELRNHVKYRAKMFRSQLILVDIQNPQRRLAGMPLRDLRPNKAVDAICTKQPEELYACLMEVLELPELRRVDMQNYLDAVLSDTRLAYQMTPDEMSQLKVVLTEEITQAGEPAACAKALTDRLLTPEEPPAKRDINQVIQDIAQEMAADCHLPFTTEGLAKQHGLTPRYLNKVFREKKGVRPMEYLVTLRMQRAKELLETTPDAMIKDVANSVGYTDPLYFSKTFKKEIGKWPTEFQENNRK